MFGKLADKYTLDSLILRQTDFSSNTNGQQGPNMPLNKNMFTINVLAFVFSLPLTNYALASQNTSQAPGYKISLNQGITYEDFYWNIAGNPTPDILSELNWRDMELARTTLSLEAKQSRLISRIEINYGRITSGRNQDSDYFQSGRTDEFSRSYSSVSGETIGFNLSLGYEIPLTTRSPLTLSPMVGFSKYEQRLGTHNGTKVIGHNGTESIPVNVPLVGLDSSYDTDWQTFWLGGELSWRTAPRLSIHAGYQYHFNIDYTARANWNLRTDFQRPISYIHQAENGSGHKFSLTTGYKLKSNLILNLNYTYVTIKATDGLDTTFLVNNTQPTTKLNIAELESHSVLIGLTWAP